MKKEICSFIGALCFASLMLLVSVAYLGCHKQAGEGVTAGDININLGGGGVSTSQAPAEPGGAAAATADVKLVRLNGVEMDVLDFPFAPLVVSIKAKFSEDMNAQSVEAAFSLLDSANNKVAGAITLADKKTMVFKPEKALQPKAKYSLQISKDAATAAGGAFEPIAKTFTTMTLGDVNGDGVPDFVVGALGVGNNDEGAAYVYSGNALAGAKPIATVNGLAANVRFGSSVAIAGDLDADGYADVVAGAPLESVNALIGVGVVYGFSGKNLMTAGTIDTSKADSVIQGPTLLNNGMFGAAIAGGGDLDGDNVDDLLVGSWGWNISKGRLYVFSGTNVLKGSGTKANAQDTAKAVIDGEADSYFGYSAAVAGDVDKDNLPEIVVGAPGKPNMVLPKVYIFKSTALDGNKKSGDALVAITGNMGSGFGSSVAGLGDTDGDEVDDILVGAPDEMNAIGASYEFSGKKLGPATALSDGKMKPGENQKDNFGYAVAIVGDLEPDGKANLAIGAPYAVPAQPKGKIYIFKGLGYMENSGAAANDRFGFSISGIGDADGDGKADFVVGAPAENKNGAARVYLSNSGVVVHEGQAVGDAFGISVSGVQPR